MKAAFRPALLAGSLCLAAALPAAATTYVMMEDAALADQASIIVEGRIESAARASDAPYAATEYTVAVTRTIQGTTSGDTVEVRVLGGLPRDDGPWFHAWGVPRFQPGEAVLLFLSPRPDARLELVQLALGAFRSVAREGRRFAVRPELSAHGLGGPDRVRDLDAFADWLADRARGISRPADYFTDPPAGGVARLAERFTLFEDESGRNFRWFDFDQGLTVDFRANASGQSGMAGGGFAEVTHGLWVWNLDKKSNVALRNRGETSYSGRFGYCDGYNLVLFDDPHDEISGSYDCDRGGTLAIGGGCVNGTGTFEGKQYWRISEGDILTQDGAGCAYGAAGGKVGEYVFGHEAGHTLGIGHSCGNPGNDPGCSNPAAAAAIMAASVSARAVHGASLGHDDRAAVRTLYPEADDGGGEEPSDGWLTTREIPGFRFRVTILPGGDAEPVPGAKEDGCLAETLCVSGAIAGRVEVQLRISGPKPNGKLWPTFTKFTTSAVEIDVEQTSSGVVKSYDLTGAGPGDDTLNGLFDRDGFDPS